VLLINFLSAAGVESATGIRAGRDKRDNAHTAIPPLREPRNLPGSSVLPTSSVPSTSAGPASATVPLAAIIAPIATVPYIATVAPASSRPPAANDAAPTRIPFEKINWFAFDDRKFFRDLGVEIDPNKGLPGILEAIYKCFKPPAGATGSVLDATKFNQTIVEKFVTELMATIGYEPTSARIDPALSKNLFKRWFLQIASPPSGSGNGGDTVSPFHDLLLRVTHPGSSHRKVCANAGSAEAQSPLPRIAELRDKVGQLFSETYRRFQAGSIVEWAEWVESTIDGLFEIFEPAMARKDLPDSFRYGSLDWALLTIGIELVGDAHTEMPYDQLILLGAAADVFSDIGSPDDTQAGEEAQAFRQKCMHAILRMAHVQGKIDLLDKREATLEDVETALTFFQSQSRSLESESAPYEELIAGLQTRSEVPKDMLREKDLDPDQVLPVSLLTTRGGVIGTQRLYRPACTPDTVQKPQSKCAPLYEIFMMDWHDQLRFGKTLDGEQKQLLETLSHDELEKRFKEGFDRVLTRLKREVMAPALRKKFQSLSAEDQEFLECGEWKVKVVTDAAIITDGGIGSGGLGPTASRIKKNRMIGAVLMASTLAKNGEPETRRYWMTLDPLEIQPYGGSDQALFQNETLLHRFFKPLKDGDKLLKLVASSELRYRTYSAQSAGERPERRMVDLLLEDVVANMQKAAHQTTGPEAIRADRKKFWLHLLVPFFSCIESLHAGEAKKAISDCTLDVLAAATSFAGPAAKAGRTMFSLGRQMTRERIKSVANALIRNRVGKDFNTFSTVLKFGGPAKEIGKEIGAAAVRYLDPVIAPTVDLLSGAARVWSLLGGRGAPNLIEKLEKVPTASSFVKKMRGAGASRRQDIADFGFRPVARNAAVPSRPVQVAPIEEAARQPHEGGALDPADPIFRNDVAHQRAPVPSVPQMVRGELAPAASSGADGAIGPGTLDGFKKALAPARCRTERAGEGAIRSCHLVRDPLFGPTAYSWQTRSSFSSHQFPLLDDSPRSAHPTAPNTVRKFDACRLGYTAYEVSPSGVRRDIMPDPDMQFAQLPAHGHIESLTPEAGGPPIEHAVFTTRHYSPATGTTAYITRYIPLGTYRERNGALVAIGYLDAETPFKALPDASGIPPAGQHHSITLKPAEDGEVKAYWCFQRAMAVDQHAVFPLVADASKLLDQTAEVKARFNVVFEESLKMLKDAISAMENEQVNPLVV
jgi:hypothetical protein